MKGFLLAGATVFALATSAFAADRPVAYRAAPVPIAAFDWSGWYIGGNAGWADPRTRVFNPLFSPGAGTDIGPHQNNATLGGFIGVQKQFGQWVLGVEGGYSHVFGWSKSAACWDPAPVLVPGGTMDSACQSQLRDVWTVGPRLGWAMGNWMPYVTGGWADGSFRFRATDPTGTVLEVAKKDIGGWYAGGGADIALAGGWIFGVEYRHYDFSKKSVNAVAPGGVFLENVTFDPRADVVVARLSYKFGDMWGKAPVVAKY